MSLVSLGVGLAAAGVGAAIGLAAERVAVGSRCGPPWTTRAARSTRRATATLRATPIAVEADDGTLLHVEVDEPEAAAGARRRGAGDAARNRSPSSSATATRSPWTPGTTSARRCAGATGWCSGTSAGTAGPRPGRTGPRRSTRSGADLRRVLEAVAPAGPLVLVGHSMGGMTMMSLARAAPRAVRRPGARRRLRLHQRRRPRPGRLRAAAASGRSCSGSRRAPSGRSRGRRAWSSAAGASAATWRRCWSAATPTRPGCPRALVRFTADMIASTRLEVISDFLPTFSTHDKLDGAGDAPTASRCSSWSATATC